MFLSGWFSMLKLLHPFRFSGVSSDLSGMNIADHPEETYLSKLIAALTRYLILKGSDVLLKSDCILLSIFEI